MLVHPLACMRWDGDLVRRDRNLSRAAVAAVSPQADIINRLGLDDMLASVILT
jgi:hypothetical protein